MTEDTSLPNLRPATADDTEPLLEFIRPFVIAKQLLPRERNDVVRLFQYGFVAEDNGDVIGCAAVEVYSAKMAEIQCLAVSPYHQRKGIGKALVLACVQRARELNVLELMTITDSERLFVDCGFHYSLPNQKRALFIQTRDD